MVERRRRDLIGLDALVALALTLLPQVSPPDPGGGRGGTLSWLLGAAVALPVAVRRLWPVPVLVVVLVAAVVTSGVDVGAGAGPAIVLAVVYALYPVVAAGRGRPGVSAVRLGGACVAGAALLAVSGGTADVGRAPGRLLLALLVLGATWAAATAVRERRESLRLVVEQAAERATIEERLRIARDLHDVVTHSVGLIAVKAGVANHVAAERPDEAREALVVIEEVSRTALRDLRSTLAVLRQDGEAGAGHPGPGLSDLRSLVRVAEAAGVTVDLQCDLGRDLQGDGGGDVPVTVARAAFRIVQEALTNVVRHAGPTCCRVRLVADAGTLTITVTDDGPAVPVRRPTDVGGGLGLVGMGERVRAHGGTFSAGPGPGRGFRVVATLPYGPRGRPPRG